MNVHLSTRLIVRAGIPAALLFAIVMWVASQQSFRRVLEQTERASQLNARQHAAELAIGLSRVTKIPEMMALELESGRLKSAADVESFLRGTLSRNRDIYGSCIAFEPHAFDPAQRYYAPYFYWMDGEPEFVQLGKPDYDYPGKDWYRLPKQADRPLWSEPYFDDGGGNAVMTTYSVPFQREGKFWGIATIDIAMSELVRQAERLEAGGAGYVFIVSKQGRFLAHPDPAQIMTGMIAATNPELSRRMLAGEDGFLRTRDPRSGGDAWVAFVPVPAGELFLAIVYPRAELRMEALRLQSELLILGFLGLIVMIIVLIIIARSISKPIVQLAHAAQEVAAGNFGVSLDTRAPVSEVRHLTQAFNKMTRDLQMRMQELQSTTAIKERLEGELSAARTIQMSLLPKKFPAFPDRQEIDIHAIVRPAREVGGDFFDYYFIDENRLCLVIGDVSGKGIPAALFMAVTKTLLKASTAPTRTAAETVERVNRELYEESAMGTFVTLLYAVLDTRTGELQLCNAGHLPPFHISAAGEAAALKMKPGAALGLVPDLRCEVSSRQLAPGDTVFLYTDGVTEALNPRREFFAGPRLHALLAGAQAHPVAELTRRVVQEVETFCAEREQADDISVLALRWLGPVPSSPQSRPSAAPARGAALV